MRNSIFRSYSKKILKSEAFISVVIVFVLAIGIIGTSYALYMDVDTDTDYELVSVGDLKVGFENGDSTINLENMTPTDDDIALTLSNNIFSFYIYNTGTYTADYNIKIETIDGNEVDTKFINYQICKDNAQNCENVTTLSEVKDNIVYKDILAPKKESDITNPSVYYFLRIWINNKYDETESKNIKLKTVIEVKNANSVLDNKNTLSGAILNNENIAINNSNPDLNDIETLDKGLYKTKDNYGVSYYFRGNSNYNYVLFNNMCFRVIRIEGNGSVRLLLSDINGECSSNNWNIGDSTKDNKSVYDAFLEKLPINKLNKTTFCTSDNELPSLICEDDYIINDYVYGLSKDELIFAGLLKNVNNDKLYLNGNFWINNIKDTNKYSLTADGDIKLSDKEVLSNRPVISLKSNTLINGGEGTVDSPYEVK